MLLDDKLRAQIECRLVTIGRRSGEARAVRIWFAAVGDWVYLLSEQGARAHWVQNVAAEPRVQVRFGERHPERSFEGPARVLGPSDPEDKTAREAWAMKYGTDRFEKFLVDALPVAVDLEREVRAESRR